MRCKVTVLLSAILIILTTTGCADNTASVSTKTTANIAEDGEPTLTTEVSLPTGTSEAECTPSQNVVEKTEYSNENIPCEPIDQSLNCEEILLEKAEELRRLMTDYLSMDENKLVYVLGEMYIAENIYETYKVISDEIKCYADIKSMFSDSIYSEYFDYINSETTPRLYDINGELYYQDHVGGYMGTIETWYIGYDVYDDKIVGHFAQLEGIGEPEEASAEHLNNESNYNFYDITVQNIDGNYVITDCRDTSSGKAYDYYQTHGWSYNSGVADRNLITNENVVPKFIEILDSTT